MTSRLRIGFDARALAFPAGGVRRYANELFSRLPALAPDMDFIAVDPPPGLDLPSGTQPGPHALALPTNLARAALSLPVAVRLARVDVFHAPAYTAPLVGRTPVVLTIHDVSYARRPEFYAHRSGALRQWFYRRSALRAARVITDSAFSRDEIGAAYGIPASRISVVPLGVGPSFTPVGQGLSLAEPGCSLAGDVGRGFSLAGRLIRPPYVLHVGDLHPRRDLVTALRAVIDLRQRGEAASLQLVCAGADHGSAGALRQAAEAAGAADALILPGPVPEADLVNLYQQAVALVYPSLYEGFGLPVLEAMACGLPVVAARAGSVPEVLGDAGILVEPGNAKAMASALATLLAYPDRRVDLRSRGLARASAFSWDRTARETLAVYLSVGGWGR